MFATCALVSRAPAQQGVAAPATQPASPEVESLAPPSRAASRGHPNGPYLRLGFGLARMSPSVETAYTQTHYSGDTLAYEVMIGGKASWFDAGLGAVGLSMRDAWRQGAGDAREGLRLNIAGPFVGLHPVPDGRLSFQLLVGFATLDIDQHAPARAAQAGGSSGAPAVDGTIALTGVGIVGGVGYWLWSGARWNVGVVAKLHHATVSGSAHGTEHRSRFATPALLVTGSVH